MLYADLWVLWCHSPWLRLLFSPRLAKSEGLFSPRLAKSRRKWKSHRCSSTETERWTKIHRSKLLGLDRNFLGQSRESPINWRLAHRETTIQLRPQLLPQKISVGSYLHTTSSTLFSNSGSLLRLRPSGHQNQWEGNILYYGGQRSLPPENSAWIDLRMEQISGVRNVIQSFRFRLADAIDGGCGVHGGLQLQ